MLPNLRPSQWNTNDQNFLLHPSNNFRPDIHRLLLNPKQGQGGNDEQKAKYPQEQVKPTLSPFGPPYLSFRNYLGKSYF